MYHGGVTFKMAGGGGDRERIASVATNATQSKGKLHEIFSSTSINISGFSSYNDFTNQWNVSTRAFADNLGQDVQTFTGIMLLNLDQLEKQLDKDEFQGDRSMAAFCVINKQFQKFIDWQYFLDYDSEMTEEYFAKFT
ncbi:hypothetical protein Tco_0201892 [Tanacetum coccineum]